MIWVKGYNEDREGHDIDIFNVIQKVQDIVAHLKVGEKQIAGKREISKKVADVQGYLPGPPCVWRYRK